MTLSLLLFLSIGILAFFLEKFRKNQYNDLIIFLGAISILLFSLDLSDSAGQKIIGGIAAYLSVFFLLSKLIRSQKDVFGFVGVTIPLITLFLFNDSLVEFNGVQTSLVNKFTIAGLFAGIVTFIIGKFTQVLSEKLRMDEAKLSIGLGFVLAGIAIFLGSFGASEIGVLLVMTPIVVGSFFNDKNELSGGLTVLFAFLLIVFGYLGVESIQLNHPDVMLALLIGLGAGFIVSSIKDRRLILSVLLVVMLIVISIGLTFAGSIFELTGGADALIALILGVGWSFFVNNKIKLGVGIPMLLFFSGSFFIPARNEEIIEKDPVLISDTLEVNEVSVSIDSLSGIYDFQIDRSKVNFNVIGKSVTKGAFSKVDGNFNADEKSISVELKLENFTTFSSYRDDELRGKDYFDSEKYPAMNYEVESIESSGGSVIGNGKFTMLGKTKPLNVEVDFKEVDGQLMLTGTGKLNRTEFGMTPNSTEGNEVEFTFEVPLIQK